MRITDNAVTMARQLGLIDRRGQPHSARHDGAAVTRTGATRAVPSIAPPHLRVGAVLVDLGVLLLVMIVAIVVVQVADAVSPAAATVAWPLEAVVLLGFVMWNLGVRQGRRGASIGKSIVGLQVVNVDTLEPTCAGRGVVRCLTHWVDAILMVGVIHAVVDIENQTLIDRWLRTLVVTESSTR